MKPIEKDYWKHFVILVGLAVVAVFGTIALIIGFFIFVDRTNKWNGPTEGLWYCEELQLQLSFTEHYESVIEHNDLLCYVYSDGKYIMCSSGMTRRDRHALRVKNQDIWSEENDQLGEDIFVAKNVSFNDESYIVKDENGKEYTFLRIKEFNLKKHLSAYKKEFVEIDLQENPERVDHVEVVAKIASDLWKQTFAEMDFSEEDIQILYDYEARCWLATVSSASDDLSFNALIEKDGDVLGVWEQEGSSESSD